MKAAAALTLGLLLLAAPAAGAASGDNPIEKVIQMISDLEAKIIKEGAESQKVYAEFTEWCEDRSRELHFQIKGVKAEVEEAQACMTAQEDKKEACETKLEECSADLNVDEADIKSATEIRDKEATDFGKESTELKSIISMLERAIAILEREMSKGYTMLQLKSASSLADAMKVIVQALGLNVADTQTLTSFVQSSSEAASRSSSDEDDGDGDEDTGAPDPSAYENHSGDIVAELQKLLDKAKAQLEDLMAQETTDQMNFEVLAQGLKGEITADQKCVDGAKKCIATAGEEGAECNGDFEKASKDLALLVKDLADLHKECMGKAEDFEAEVKSRAEELKALAEAKKVISQTTGGEGGAEELSYDLNQESSDASFLQVSRSRAQGANFQVVHFIRDLARKHHSAVLAQLASRISIAIRNTDASGDDPFAKVKGLIQGLIEKLLAEAEAEATHKAYCDKEIAETKEKKEDKSDEIAKLSAKIDAMTARAAKLEDEVAKLQKEISELLASQAEMDKIRAEEKAVYDTNKPELEEGITGVKLALKILRAYYAKEDKAHGAAEGAASGIIGLLEVVESDLTQGLAETVASEEAAVAKYEQETKENEVLKVTMDQDVKYKTKELKELEEAVAEATSDKTGVETELAAVLEYLSKLEDQCIAKPEPYEERVRRREAEIDGLKEALEILSGEAVLLQRSSTRRLRGPRVA